jgi:hypothetical protein
MTTATTMATAMTVLSIDDGGDDSCTQDLGTTKCLAASNENGEEETLTG